jgi:hypothetical protein
MGGITMTTEVTRGDTQSQAQVAAQAYVLEGTMLEACNCNVLCPCWIGEDPDNGTCDSVIAYHIDRGQVTGVDVSGLTVLEAHHIPGNVLAGNWRQVILIDDRASDDQIRVLGDAFQGRLGGPLGDLAGLVGERLGVYPAPIDHQLSGGEGTVTIGDKLRAATVPYRSAYGTTTTLRDSIFSTLPGSPAWVAKATEMTVNMPEHGLVWTFSNTNAIQGDFKFEH